MEEFNKNLNTVLFLVIIICFFLPFFNLTCQNQKIASITGLELISGTSISTDQINKGMKSLDITEPSKGIKAEEVPPEFLALIAFLLAVAGFIISFFWKFAKIGSAAVGLMGAAALIYLSSFITEDILGKTTFQPLNVECAYGFYVALILFITALLYNAYIIVIRANYVTEKSTIPEEKIRVCPSCGTVNDRVSMYCYKCGSSMEIF
jgi:hypothetical protein